MAGTWLLSQSITLLEGQSTTMVWRYPYTDPFGQVIGNYEGPQLGLACPVSFGDHLRPCERC